MKPDDFRSLVAAGLTTEQIALVMEMMDRDTQSYVQADEARKSKARERIARWRRNRDVTETLPNVTEPLTRAVEDKPLPTDNNKPTKTNTHTADLAAFKAALAGECDSERIDAFVKLRKTKRGQNTGHAAVLFKAAAAKCGLSIPEAIDTCIRRNWITVEPEWLAKPQARAGPAGRNPNLSELYAVKERMERENAKPELEPAETSLRYLPAANG